MSMAKFKELVHLVIYECRDNPWTLGAIRLNKVLWFADVFVYQKTGESISGMHYVRRPKGPAPRPILPVLREMEEAGTIRIEEQNSPYAPRLFHSLVEPQNRLLSHEEQSVTKEIVDAVRGLSAADVSEITHDEIWEAAEDGEEIPLYATLASGTGEITHEVRRWADNCLAELALP